MYQNLVLTVLMSGFLCLYKLSCCSVLPLNPFYVQEEFVATSKAVSLVYICSPVASKSWKMPVTCELKDIERTEVCGVWVELKSVEIWWKALVFFK